MGFDFTYFIGKDELKYGIEVLGFDTDFQFSNAIGTTISQNDNTTELGAFVKYKKTFGKLLFEPSVRLQWYASLSNISLEPRLAMKYNAAEKFRIKFAGGMYSQNLISATSDRDVVNLFYGFLSGPDNVPQTFNGKDITHKLQKAEHAILGFEIDISRFVTANIEGYYKNFSQLTNLNRNKLYDEEKYPYKPDIYTKDFIFENGYATGVDLTLKYDNKRLYLWIVYSLGEIRRNYEDIDSSVKSYYPHFDRRHNINVVTSYLLTDKQDWEINARWNFGSGFPFTLTQGYYPLISFTDGIYTDYTTVNEELGILYADLNTGRLSTYHRLDFGLKKIFMLGRYSKLEATLSITNVYNRKNIFYVDRYTFEKIYQLPFMPSIGLMFSF
jgi:hypothetical protein